MELQGHRWSFQAQGIDRPLFQQYWIQVLMRGYDSYKQFHIRTKLMERESLAILYRRALANVKKNQIDIDQLSEAEFVNTYSSDPFFQARVDVQLQKIVSKLKTAGSTSPVQSQEEWETTTLRKKSSKQLDKYVEKCKKYLELIASCK